MSQTGLPLPLGGNVVRKDLGEETINEIARLLRESIEYALEHRQEALDYALNYARDLDPKLADEFVGMYVNQWTVDYGPRGREAVRTLLNKASEAGLIPTKLDVEVRGLIRPRTGGFSPMGRIGRRKVLLAGPGGRRRDRWRRLAGLAVDRAGGRGRPSPRRRMGRNSKPMMDLESSNSPPLRPILGDRSFLTR